MSKYDEFDLDIKGEADGTGVSPASSSNVCWGISTAVSGSFLTGCTGECTAPCSAKCGTPVTTEGACGKTG